MTAYTTEVIKSAISQGYWLSVADEEGVILTRTQNVQAVETHIDDVEEATVIAYAYSESEQRYRLADRMWVVDGEINDYITNGMFHNIIKSTPDTRL